MKVFRGLPNIESRLPSVIAIGNFDGVHRGHQALLKEVRKVATHLGLNAVVMIFEPHPRTFFAQLAHTPEKAPSRITNLRDKLKALSKTGIDRVIIKSFNNSFANLLPQEFIEKILIQGLNVRCLMVGKDFCFGAKRSGNIDTLINASKQYNFKLWIIPNVHNDSIRISSSEIRIALANADLQHARQLLGHAYTISGRVVHGRKLGRTIGFPTLNMRIKHQTPALLGIFIAQVHGIKIHPLPAMTSIGIRPTVDNTGEILLETHIFDYTGNCYGKLLCIEFLQKLHDEKKYVDISALTLAMMHDAEQARNWFKK